MAEPTYGEIQRVLSECRSLSDAAEAHGTLAGSLCAVVGVRLQDWLAEVLPDGEASAEAAASLRELFDATARALEGPDAAFEPLLPDDDASLEDRSAALGEWCHGFLYGLGAGRMRDPGALREDIGEILRDLTEITHVAVDPAETEETNEGAYAELVEFVRVGIQILYEELRPLRAEPPPREQAVLH